MLPYLIPAGLALLGGLMGSKEKTTGQTNPTSQTTTSSGSHGSSTQNKIDPRMEEAIYGAGGIMPNVAAWYKNNSSGMNDKMITGMNNQWNQLNASKQGWDQMQNLGMGLMGGGVVGNPFTGGGGIAPQQMSFKPAEMNMSNNANSPFVMPKPMAAPAMLPSAPSGGGGGGGEPSPYPTANVAPVDYAGPKDGVGMGGLGGRDGRGGGVAGGGNNGYWFTDESGAKFWQKTGGGGSTASGNKYGDSYGAGSYDGTGYNTTGWVSGNDSGYDGSWRGGENGSGEA